MTHREVNSPLGEVTRKDVQHPKSTYSYLRLGDAQSGSTAQETMAISPSLGASSAQLEEVITTLNLCLVQQHQIMQRLNERSDIPVAENLSTQKNDKDQRQLTINKSDESCTGGIAVCPANTRIEWI